MDVFMRKAMMGANTLLGFLMSHTGAMSSSHCLVVESSSRSSTSPVVTSSAELGFACRELVLCGGT